RQELTEEAIEHVQKKHTMSMDMDRATGKDSGMDEMVNGKTTAADVLDDSVPVRPRTSGV
ncbi:hypothetical protein LTR53_017740, partial [Teratosphaeriaceae sp. CCFEE 6253]